jgi:hemerythrin-like domain-containing protein
MAQVTDDTCVFDGVPSDVGPLGDPLAYLAHDHATQRALADLLEGVADGLPDGVDRRAAALGGHSLRMLAARRWALEEQALFPLIESRAPENAPARRAIAIARREHRETAGRAIELADELDALADSGRARNPDALGFMLRAFFDGLRRHLDWTEAAILPAARDGLDDLGLRRDAMSLDRDALFCDRVWRDLVGGRRV